MREAILRGSTEIEAMGLVKANLNNFPAAILIFCCHGDPENGDNLKTTEPLETGTVPSLYIPSTCTKKQLPRIDLYVNSLGTVT